MKTFFLLLFCSAVACSLFAADELLIPVALNPLVPKIHAGMTSDEVEKVLATEYPGVKRQLGDWSGTTGYVEYRLSERYTLSVSSTMRNGHEVVHDEILLYLYDWPAKRRLDLKVFDWEKLEKK
ncbi:MAG TPA: hypothetical protein VK961_13530 [Chthoniobacter sp.]|nr:hypothetical protein [Chthoniobacter sp.]